MDRRAFLSRLAMGVAGAAVPKKFFDIGAAWIRHDSGLAVPCPGIFGYTGMVGVGGVMTINEARQKIDDPEFDWLCPLEPVPEGLWRSLRSYKYAPIGNIPWKPIGEENKR